MHVQVVQHKVTMKNDRAEHEVMAALLRTSLDEERERTTEQSIKIKNLNSTVRKYKLHKKVLVQELRSRRKEHRDSSSSIDGSSIGSSRSNSVSSNGDGDARGKQSNTCASSQHDEIGSIKNNGSKNDGSSSAATTHHVVSSEDNFNSLSILYDMSISDIKRLNRLFGKSQQWCFCWLGLFFE